MSPVRYDSLGKEQYIRKVFAISILELLIRSTVRAQLLEFQLLKSDVFLVSPKRTEVLTGIRKRCASE